MFIFHETLYFPGNEEYQEEAIEMAAQEAAEEAAEKGKMSYEEAFTIALEDAKATAQRQKEKIERENRVNTFIGFLLAEGGKRWKKNGEDLIYFGKETYYDLNKLKMCGSGKRAKALREMFELDE